MKIKDAVKRAIASNIRRARIDANMTQLEAANKLGITAQAISNFERGINGIENSLLIRMCELYGKSMSSILGEEEENSPTSHGGGTAGHWRGAGELFHRRPNDQRVAVHLRCDHRCPFRSGSLSGGEGGFPQCHPAHEPVSGGYHLL